jgi:hypothetical protein
MSNRTDILDSVLQSAEYLDSEYITEKILTLLGDGDKVEAVLSRKASEESARYSIESM